MSSQIINNIRTTEERDKLTTEIDIMLASLYQAGALDRALNSQVRSWVAQIVRSELPSDLSQGESYLRAIKEEIEKIKVIELKLAFEPTEVTIDKISAYLRESLQTPVLISFEYDPRILGGAEIKLGGEYRDFTLRRLFEEEYKKEEKELIKLMYTK